MGKLIIKGYGTSGIEVDVSIPIALNKAIADIANPSSRGGEWSKTVSISGTDDINEALSHIYDINSFIESDTQYNPSFNPNKRADVIYSEDGIILLSGYMRLLEINKLLETSQIVYNCQVLNPVADFWNAISNKRMEDIDLTKYNHNLTASLVRKSWDQNIIENSVQVAYAKGKGYVHGLINKKPVIDGVDPTTSWDVGETTPCIYAKELVDAIYSDIGQSYESGGFFDSAEFKNWVLPYNGVGLGLQDADIESLKVRASTTAINTYTGVLDYKGFTKGRLGFNDDATSPNQDDGGNFSTGGAGYFKAPTTANYMYRVEMDVSVSFNSGVAIGSDAVGEVHAEIYNKTTGEIIPSNGGHSFTIITGNTSATISAFFNFNNLYLTTDDEVEFYVKAYLPQRVDISVASGAVLFIKPLSFVYGSGSLVNFTKMFNRELTQKQFMLDLVKTFNLWIGLNEKGEHIVKTRDDYLTDDVLDLTQYLNTSKEVVYMPMGALKANPYIFTYAEDKDVLNELHKFRNGEAYGTKTFRVENDFIKKEEVIQVGYAATPMKHFTQSNMVLSDVTFLEKSGEVDLDKVPKYRLLRYEGIESCNPYHVVDSSGIDLQSGYPLIGHIDDPTEPTLEGLFGMPKQHYLQPDVKYSANNLFYQYHIRQYAEVTNRNSKIVKAYLNIPSHLYNQMTFDKKYWFDNAYFRLNKVSDFRPEEDTLCEFIKYTPYAKPTLNTSTGNGGVDEDDGISDRFPTWGQLNTVRDNIGFAKGKNNKGTKDTIYLGDRNTSTGTSKAAIFGSGNNVHPTVNEVVVLNTDDTEIDKDGIWLDGLHMDGVFKIAHYQTAADQEEGSTTFADITGLSHQCLEGGVYRVNFDIMFSNSNVADGVQIRFSTSGAGSISGMIQGQNTNGVGAMQAISINTDADIWAVSSVATADKTYNVRGEVIYRPTADSVLGLQVAAGNGAGTAKVKEGSILSVTEL